MSPFSGKKPGFRLDNRGRPWIEIESSRLQRLDTLYHYYDAMVTKLQVSCAAGCAACCTRNVWMTRIEAFWLLSALPEETAGLVCSLLIETQSAHRSIPTESINNSLSNDEGPGQGGQETTFVTYNDPCPLLLADDRCSIYDARPFACRCMLSASACAGRGFAEQPQWLIWMNTIFLQAIEHLDHGGFTGNLIDVVPRVCGQRCAASLPVVANSPIRYWAVPPAYRQRLTPVVQRLWEIIS
jgi:Fe-S-cluster containining protein